MAFPAGVTTAVVAAGPIVDFHGTPADHIRIGVVPIDATGKAVRIVHAATGTVLSPVRASFTDSAGVASFEVPHVDQAGFRWGDQTAATGWSYEATVIASWDGTTDRYRRTFQVVSGQNMVDLDAIADGVAGEPGSSPVPAVTSVNGQTGDVSLEQGTIFVTDHGAKGDGATDDHAAITAAVAAALASGSALHWPAGDYFTAAGSSIPDLHSVRHTGTGRLRAGSFTFYPAPVSGQANTLYVDPTGADTNDGLHTSRPFREIRAAVAALKLYASPLRGSWKVKAAAGTYKGGVSMPPVRNGAQDDFLRIEGPTVGHPNVPTAVIDKAADTAATIGVTASDGAALYLQDMKVVGGFSYSVDVRRNVYLWLKNFHGDGQGIGGSGIAVNSHCRYYVAGGRLENYTSNGIQELFHVTRAFNNVSAAADQMVIRGCDVGLQAKENCVGHLDWLTLEDNGTGVEMNGYCVVNTKGVVIRRNALGYANVNSEVHNEGSIVWGTGVDANTRDFITLGAGQELSVSGWADSSTARTMNVGHRPLVTIGATYADATLNSTAETIAYNFVDVLPAHRYATAGKHFIVRAKGRVMDAALTADYRLILRLSGAYVIDVRVPAGTPAGAVFTAEWDTVCSADGNNQKTFSSISVNGTGSTGYGLSSRDLTNSSASVRVSGIGGAAADKVTVHMIEVWG